MALIAPSLLAADFGILKEQIALAENAGVQRFHLDVMDGHFVPNISFGAMVVRAVRQLTKQCLDVHLMVEQPERFISQFANNGADVITVHVEATSQLHRAITLIKDLGLTAGVALNPATPLTFLDEILDEVDLVLLMSVDPGFGGQKFMPSTLNKIERLSGIIGTKSCSAQISVDGGINKTNASKVVEAGADILVAGSAVFGSKDISGSIKALMAAARPSYVA